MSLIIDRILEAYFSGTLPEPIAKKVLDWFANDRHKEEKYQALENIFEKNIRPDLNPDQEVLAEYNRISKLIGFTDKEQPKKQIEPRKRILRRVIIGVAAAIIPLIMIAGYIYFNDRQVEQPLTAAIITVTAERTSKKEIVLPDGSRVTMSPGSLVEYNEKFVDGRKVRLEGEAFFSVEKDELSPFTVSTNNISITVHGTEFKVTDLPEIRSVVTLKSGSVTVNSKNKETKLEPGQRLFYSCSSEDITISEVTLEEIETECLDFYMTPLSEIIRTIESYYDVSIEQPNGLLEKRYTIRFFPEQSIAEVMSILSSLAENFEYKITDGKVKTTTK